MKNLWGLEVSIDLKHCNSETIRDTEAIKKYINKLSSLIKFKKYKETIVVHFGNKPEIEGFSMVQLIETSLISGHFVNSTNSAYINIFSCRSFNPIKVVEFTQRYFKAETCEFITNYRTI